MKLRFHASKNGTRWIRDSEFANISKDVKWWSYIKRGMSYRDALKKMLPNAWRSLTLRGKK